MAGKPYTDYTGQKFKTITVLRRASKEEIPWKSHETAWLVECNQCGRKWVARKSEIPNGCYDCNEYTEYVGGRGHYDKTMIGRRFGKLTVIAIDKERRTSSKEKSYWRCQCDCGNIVSVRGDHLKGRWKNKNGVRVWCTTSSCGCSNKSKGESIIEDLLSQHNINYSMYYQIADFSKFSLFDFAILDEDNNLLYLIEYDGEQHFVPVEHYGGEEKFKVQQERDNNKNNYCKEHNIPLIRIPYTDLKDITWDYLVNKIPELLTLSGDGVQTVYA